MAEIINFYLLNTILPSLNPKNDITMKMLLKNKIDIDDKVDEFIFQAFNNHITGEYDVVCDDEYMELFKNSHILCDIINYVRDYYNDNYGYEPIYKISVENVARQYALIWAFENKEKIEIII